LRPRTSAEPKDRQAAAEDESGSSAFPADRLQPPDSRWATTNKDERVKISGSGSSKPVAPTGLPEVTPAKTTGVPAPAAAAADDKVEITSISAQLAQLEQLLGTIGIVDAARVDAIKQAIAEGRFRVDSEVVADRLLATVREFLANQKP
jgi:negative regulator of flagellin synthesis FlgM